MPRPFEAKEFTDELDGQSPDYSLMKILKPRMVPVKLHPIILARMSGKS